MKKAAVTGHTAGLGKVIKEYLESQNYIVQGFSKSAGCDLRDYAQVTTMITQIHDVDLFVNCAKPDYAQSQILYRLAKSEFKGKVLNIGSPVVYHNTGWTDLGLLEYVTQKTALFHAHQTLVKFYPEQLIMWDPKHTTDIEYVAQCLKEFGF